MQYYYFVIEIVTGKYLGTKPHIDDASANIPKIFLEQFGVQKYLGPVTVYKRCLFHIIIGIWKVCSPYWLSLYSSFDFLVQVMPFKS